VGADNVDNDNDTKNITINHKGCGGGGGEMGGEGKRTGAAGRGGEAAIAIALRGARGRMIHHLLWQRRRGLQQRQDKRGRSGEG
jgi:hypothetical protein